MSSTVKSVPFHLKWKGRACKRWRPSFSCVSVCVHCFVYIIHIYIFSLPTWIHSLFYSVTFYTLFLVFIWMIRFSQNWFVAALSYFLPCYSASKCLSSTGPHGMCCVAKAGTRSTKSLKGMCCWMRYTHRVSWPSRAQVQLCYVGHTGESLRRGENCQWQLSHTGMIVSLEGREVPTKNKSWFLNL